MRSKARKVPSRKIYLYAGQPYKIVWLGEKECVFTCILHSLVLVCTFCPYTPFRLPQIFVRNPKQKPPACQGIQHGSLHWCFRSFWNQTALWSRFLGVLWKLFFAAISINNKGLLRRRHGFEEQTYNLSCASRSMSHAQRKRFVSWGKKCILNFRSTHFFQAISSRIIWLHPICWANHQSLERELEALKCGNAAIT